MLNLFVFALSWCPTPFSLPTDSQIHTLYVFSFSDPLWRWWSKLSNYFKYFLYFFFVCINCHYLFPWIIKRRTLFACYRPIFTLDIGYTKAEPSLLFILEGGLFRLIVRVIFTGFNINFPSSYLGNRILCSFNFLVTGGPLTFWMWTSSKKTSWVDVRDGSFSLSYQDGSCLISTSSLL